MAPSNANVMDANHQKVDAENYEQGVAQAYDLSLDSLSSRLRSVRLARSARSSPGDISSATSCFFLGPNPSLCIVSAKRDFQSPPALIIARLLHVARP